MAAGGVLGCPISTPNETFSLITLLHCWKNLDGSKGRGGSISCPIPQGEVQHWGWGVTSTSQHPP